MKNDMEAVVREYFDVFTEKLLNGPPPSRGKDLPIDLVPDAKPQIRGIYRMSQPELEEVRDKIT